MIQSITSLHFLKWLFAPPGEKITQLQKIQYDNLEQRFLNLLDCGEPYTERFVYLTEFPIVDSCAVFSNEHGVTKRIRCIYFISSSSRYLSRDGLSSSGLFYAVQMQLLEVRIEERPSTISVYSLPHICPSCTLCEFLYVLYKCTY